MFRTTIQSVMDPNMLASNSTFLLSVVEAVAMKHDVSPWSINDWAPSEDAAKAFVESVFEYLVRFMHCLPARFLSSESRCLC